MSVDVVILKQWNLLNKKGAYTLIVYLWTDGDFQIELKCGVSYNDIDDCKSHTFTWNKHIGYNHSYK